MRMTAVVYWSQSLEVVFPKVVTGHLVVLLVLVKYGRNHRNVKRNSKREAMTTRNLSVNLSPHKSKLEVEREVKVKGMRRNRNQAVSLFLARTKTGEAASGLILCLAT